MPGELIVKTAWINSGEEEVAALKQQTESKLPTLTLSAHHNAPVRVCETYQFIFPGPCFPIGSAFDYLQLSHT